MEWLDQYGFPISDQAVLAEAPDVVFGISPSDPLTIVGGSLILSAVAVVASALPALRAAHVPPVTALRAE